MSDDLLPALAGARDLEQLAERVKDYVGAAKAPATLKAYRSDWDHFVRWCSRVGLMAIPASPATVAGYLSVLAETRKAATIQRRISSIAQAHRAAGFEPPPTADLLVRSTWAGIRRTIGVAQDAKAPLVVAQLRAVLGALPEGLAGDRDRALLLLGFAAALRRSELVALNVEDLSPRAEGLAVLIRRSKTDQEGAGRPIGVPYGSSSDVCPVRAVRAWLKASGITEGPIFRSVDRWGRLSAQRLSGRAVALIVKRSIEPLGLDPADFGGHSLRAGLATSAAAANVEERLIAKQTGHSSMKVLRRYIRDGQLFKDNAAGAVL